MKLIRAAYRRFVALFGADVDGKEIEAELQSHIEIACDENIRAGMSEQEARRLVTHRS